MTGELGPAVPASNRPIWPPWEVISLGKAANDTQPQAEQIAQHHRPRTSLLPECVTHEKPDLVTGTSPLLTDRRTRLDDDDGQQGVAGLAGDDARLIESIKIAKW